MKGTSLRIVIFFVAFLVGACVLDGPTREPRISNHSGSTVSIFWFNEFDEAYYRDIGPGQETLVQSYGATCAPSPMVAKTADGTVIARTEKPLCPGDVWVIAPSGAPTST